MNMHVSPAIVGSSRLSTKTVTQLYAELQAAHEAYMAACATRDFDADPASQEHFDRTLVQPAQDRFAAISNELLRTPTADPAEMLLKIKVTPAANGAAFRSLNDLDNWEDGANLDGDAVETLTYLRSDLRHLVPLAPAVATARCVSRSPRKTVTAYYQDLVNHLQAMEMLRQEKQAKGIDLADDKAWSRGIDKQLRIYEKLVATEARSLDEVLLKLKATCINGTAATSPMAIDAEFAQWTGDNILPPDDASLITAMRDDLQRLIRASTAHG